MRTGSPFEDRSSKLMVRGRLLHLKFLPLPGGSIGRSHVCLELLYAYLQHVDVERRRHDEQRPGADALCNNLSVIEMPQELRYIKVPIRPSTIG